MGPPPPVLLVLPPPPPLPPLPVDSSAKSTESAPEIKLQVTPPATTAAKRAALVVRVHGGFIIGSIIRTSP
jgi:hypothetical protein